MKSGQRRGWILAVLAAPMCGAWPQGEPSPPRNLQVQGGWVSGRQPVAGLPWFELESGLWGSTPSEVSTEWSAAVEWSGWSAWQDGCMSVGVRRVIRPGWMLEGQARAGWSLWPQLFQWSWHGTARARLTHVLPTGQFLWEIHSSVGQGRTGFHVASDSEVALGPNDWGWQGWWMPNIEGAPVPLPALGWSHGGVWNVAWGPSAQEWGQSRIWREVTSRFRVQFSFPDPNWEVAWTTSLPSRRKDPGDSTSSSSARRVPTSSQFDSGRLTLASTRRNAGSGWGWRWNFPTAVK
jgi:hypothetical protein